LKKEIPREALLELRQRLDPLPARSPRRKELVRETAELYGVSVATIYRDLQDFSRPKSVNRSDRGFPRIAPKSDLERYCEIIAAVKVRTRNKKGHQISTAEAIRLLERYGLETPSGLVKAPRDLLKRPTVDRYLTQWGYDKESLGIQQTATRFYVANYDMCRRPRACSQALNPMGFVPMAGDT